MALGVFVKHCTFPWSPSDQAKAQVLKNMFPNIAACIAISVRIDDRRPSQERPVVFVEDTRLPNTPQCPHNPSDQEERLRGAMFTEGARMVPTKPGAMMRLQRMIRAKLNLSVRSRRFAQQHWKVGLSLKCRSGLMSLMFGVRSVCWRCTRSPRVSIMGPRQTFSVHDRQVPPTLSMPCRVT